MFKWLFNRPKPAENTAPNPEPGGDVNSPVVARAPSAPKAAAASEVPPATQVAAPSAPAPETAITSTAPGEPAITTGRSGRQIGLATALLDMEDRGVPAIGMSAVALSGSRIVPAKIIKVQAGGRRVVARVSKTAVQTYSRRLDGRYWLEGAPAKTSRRLVLGASSI